MNEVAISEENIPPPTWKRRLKRYIRAALRRMKKTGWCVSVLLCDDRYIHDLNKSYRHIDAPTDVLSFRQADTDAISPDDRTVGDIVISVDTLARNAREFDVSDDEELKRLVVHGLLHLAGMDHNDDDDQDEMLILQHQLLHEIPGRIVL